MSRTLAVLNNFETSMKSTEEHPQVKQLQLIREQEAELKLLEMQLHDMTIKIHDARHELYNRRITLKRMMSLA